MPSLRLVAGALAVAATTSVMFFSASAATPAPAVVAPMDLSKLLGFSCRITKSDDAYFPEVTLINHSGVSLPPWTEVMFVADNGWTLTNSWSLEVRTGQYLSFDVVEGVSAGLGCKVAIGVTKPAPKGWPG